MLQNLRHEKILKELQAQHAVKVVDLAKELDTSESTIRRDIIELDRAGKLKKVFGGAVSAESGMTMEMTDVAERNQINIAEKERIARFAAAMVEDNDFIYIDAGTTTDRMLDYLENRSATYVTNGVAHASRLIRKGFRVYMIGGILRPMTEAAIGPAAIEAIDRYNFTKCFMGTNGIDISRGFTTPDFSEAAVKTAVMKKSHISFVLGDHTKFGRISSVTFAKLDEARIITDRVEEPLYRQEAIIEEVK